MNGAKVKMVNLHVYKNERKNNLKILSCSLKTTGLFCLLDLGGGGGALFTQGSSF
jgi:hypothetical protein